MEKRTVLVVEDDPIVRMVAVDMLEDAGCTVVEFETADKAIAFCATSENDVAAVFTDIVMPGETDGLDLAALLAKSRPSAIVVVTSGRRVDRPASLGSHVRFLVKPWRPLELLSAMKDVVDPNAAH